MKISGFIEVAPGLWYEEATGFPWSTRYKYCSGGKGNIGTKYDGQLKRIYSRKNKYLDVGINGKNTVWHRIVYEFFKGKIPESLCVDHKSNDIEDNRIENLRVTSPMKNKQKRKMNANNSVGLAGVTYRKAIGKYISRISINKRQKHLGTFFTKEGAYAAYLQAKIKYHGSESVKPLLAKGI